MSQQTQEAHRMPAEATRVYGRLSRRNVITLGVTSVASAALLLVLLIRLISAGNTLAAAPTSPLVGHAAPDFTITVWNPGSSAKTFHLADLKGSPVVVNFWASWCTDCVDEQYVFSEMYAKYQAQGVKFVGIAFQDTQVDGSTYLAKYTVAYPCGPDVSGSAPTDYIVTGVPETIFIGRDGKVVSKSPGPLDDGSLDRDIQQILR
jgi:cytochrome c biogenesis protein CcmG, thiol:disulfide interchange protein DsbE